MGGMEQGDRSAVEGVAREANTSHRLHRGGAEATGEIARNLISPVQKCLHTLLLLVAGNGAKF